eukprot:jgi/Botrbrau1/385/Bobra.110_2s0040.1
MGHLRLREYKEWEQLQSLLLALGQRSTGRLGYAHQAHPQSFRQHQLFHIK